MKVPAAYLIVFQIQSRGHQSQIKKNDNANGQQKTESIYRNKIQNSVFFEKTLKRPFFLNKILSRIRKKLQKIRLGRNCAVQKSIFRQKITGAAAFIDHRIKRTDQYFYGIPVIGNQCVYR